MRLGREREGGTFFEETSFYRDAGGDMGLVQDAGDGRYILDKHQLQILMRRDPKSSDFEVKMLQEGKFLVGFKKE